MSSQLIDVYNKIKSVEPVFKLPINYVTVDVGTFDAATGEFEGLTTETETDPEPIEHRPGQHPVNPKPHFFGESWISITIDNHWRQTFTTVPAPKVGLAPVLLKFGIKNQGGGTWSVNVRGQSVTVPAGQSSVTLNIWDAAVADWSIHFGNMSHADRIMIQRSADKIIGAGAFTIPALPLAIVYAPPADATGLSKASYEVAESIGTTSSFQLSNDVSSSQPWLPQNLSDLKDMQTGLNILSSLLSKSQNPVAQGLGEALGAIASGIGTISGSATTGTVSVDGSSITITESKTQTIYAETKNGGPGVGDAIIYLHDAKFAWLMADGQLRIALMGGVYASLPASYLRAHANEPQGTGLPPDVVQQLLAMDPFVAGGNMVQLPSDRFEEIDSQVQGPFEYGGGQTLAGAHTQTFTTTETRSRTDYTTHIQDFNPGWLAQLFGAQASTLKTTVSVTQAAGTTHSETQSINWELHSGPNERFVVELWRDRVFGTYAFRQEPVSGSPRFKGIAKAANGLPLQKQPVKLTTRGRTYSTITDKAGHFAFFARDIPAGKASLVIGNQAAQTISIAAQAASP
jgi:hypothetical protein